MNQKLSDWASIAEIVAGVAVIVTLVVLILGVRENTDVTRASVYANTIDSINELESNVLSDPELSRLWRAFITIRRDVDQITESDADRIVIMITILFRNYEKAYYTRQYGLLGEAEWARFERAICMNFERMQVLGRGFGGLEASVTDDFHAYILDTCAD